MKVLRGYIFLGADPYLGSPAVLRFVHAHT